MNERPDDATSDRCGHKRVKFLLSLNSYPGVIRWNYLDHEMGKCIEDRGQST